MFVFVDIVQKKFFDIVNIAFNRLYIINEQFTTNVKLKMCLEKAIDTVEFHLWDCPLTNKKWSE